MGYGIDPQLSRHLLDQFDDGEAVLGAAIRTATWVAPSVNPLHVLFILVHRTSAEFFAEVLGDRGTPAGPDFVLRIDPRPTDGSDPAAVVPSDLIAGLVSLEGRHKAVGFPLSVLFDREMFNV